MSMKHINIFFHVNVRKEKISFFFCQSVTPFPDGLHLNEPVSEDVTAESAWREERTESDL